METTGSLLAPGTEARRLFDLYYPSPEAQAQQRGLVGQAGVGVVRGLGTAVARVPQALSAIPGVREYTEPLAEGIEASLPVSSGKVLESGIETGVSSLATAGLAAGAVAASPLTLGPLALAGSVGVMYGAAELAETRKRLETANQVLVSLGKEPLSTGEIYRISATRGLIEGGGEALGNYIIGSRLLGGAAAEAVKNATLERLPGFAGRAVREAAVSALEEVPTEMGQAYGQSAVERAGLGPERIRALEQAGKGVVPLPWEAAKEVVGPTLVASGLFGGVGAAIARPRPQPSSGAAPAAVANAATATTTPTTPASTTTFPGAPVAKPLPFVTAPKTTGVVSPLTEEGAVSTEAPTPVGTAPVINPLTGETALAPEPAMAGTPEAATMPPVAEPAAVPPVAAVGNLVNATGDLVSREPVTILGVESAPDGSAYVKYHNAETGQDAYWPAAQFEPVAAQTSDVATLPPAAEAAASAVVVTEEAPPAVTPEAPAVEAPATTPPVTSPQQGIQQMNPQSLALDPDRFQYKIQQGQGGATGSLADVKSFDPLKAGVVQVWQDDADGQTYVVNGHNRVDLARRAGAENLYVQHIPADTAEQARAAGALTNIAEGRGTALDAAKFFRDTQATPAMLAQEGLSLRDKVARDGLALAQLNPSLFGAVARGEFPMERAVIIGRELADHAQQFALLRLIEQEEGRGKRLTNETVRELAGLAASAPTQTTTEMTLFGADERTQSLAVEKAQLLAEMRRRLAREKKLFGLVGQQAAAQDLSRAGNIIDIERSQHVSQQAAQLLDLFDRVKHLSGPINDAVNTATQRIAGGENATTVRTNLYGRLVTELPTALRGGLESSRVSRTPALGTGPGVSEPTAGSTAAQGDLLSAPEAIPPAAVPGTAGGEQQLANVPDYVRDAIQREYGRAQQLGIVNDIERLSAEGLTAQPLARRLIDQGRLPAGTGPVEVRDMVRSVRAALGIPSQEQATEFATWQQQYQAAHPQAVGSEQQLAPTLDAQRKSGTFRLSRIDNIPPDATKPHGAYYSIEQPGAVSPHAEDYPQGHVSQTTFTPQHLLDLGDTNADAGNAAARHLLGAERYEALRQIGGVTYPENALSRTSRGTRPGKTALAKELARSYPGVDWARYDDSYEMLMAVGGLEARRAGYDAILATDDTNQNLAEMVVLGARESQSGQLQVLPANAEAGQGPVTLAEVQRLFRGQEVTEQPDGAMRVAMPNQGAVVEVRNVAYITPRHGELELGYGQSELGPTQQVLGRATPMGQGLFVIEVTPERNAMTFHHEGAGHVFEDMGLYGPRDIATLNRTLQRQNQEPTAENRADLLAKRLNANTKDWAASPLMRVIRKAQLFLDKLAQLMGIRTTGQLVREVRSGAIFERQATESATERTGRLQVVDTPEDPALPGIATSVQSRVAPVAPNAIPRTSPPGIRTEPIPFEHYAFVQGMITPEEGAAFQQLVDQGVVQSRKERIPDKQMMAAGEQQKLDFESNPRELQRVLKEMHAGTRAATESQLVAFSLMADKQLQTAKALHGHGIMTDERFAEAQGAWTGPHGFLSYARMALSTFGRGTGLGRYLGPYLGGAHLYENAMYDLEQTLNAIPEDQREAFKQKLQEAFNAGDYDTLRDLAAQIPNSTLRERFFEFYYGSILSGIGTIAANEYSTAGYQLFHNALVRPIAGLIDATVSRVTGRDRQLFASEALPAIAAQFKGMPAMMKNSWWVFRGDERAQQIPAMFRRETATSMELGDTQGAWERATWQHDVPFLGAKAGDKIEFMRKVAPFVTAASRLMGALDVGLSINAFDQEVAARAARAAIQQGIPADQRAAFEANYREHFLTREGQDTVDEVMETVKSQVFRGSMGILGRTLTNLSNVPIIGPFFQLLMPFRRTPDQLLQRGFELLPGSILFTPWFHQNLQWNGWMPYVGKDALTNDAMFMLAKQAAGTMMALGLAALWNEGLITGPPPEDPAEREAFQRQGKVPYSVRVGDTWYSWRKFEPMSLPLGIITTTLDTLQHRQARMEARGEVPVGFVHDNLAIAAVGVQAGIKYVMDASYFSGIANFFAGVEGQRSGTGDIPKGVMRQVVSMVTPFVGLQRSLISAGEGLGLVPGSAPGQVSIKQPQTFSEMLMGSNVVGTALGYGPQARLDVFGRPQARVSTGIGEINPLAPPIQRGTASSSEVEEALSRLRYYPGAPAKTDAATGKKVPDAEYRRLQEIRGPLLEEALERVVQRVGFDRLDPLAAKKALQNAVSESTRRAKSQLQRETAGVR